MLQIVIVNSTVIFFLGIFITLEEILSTVYFSDITSKFHTITMFVIVYL